MAPEEFLETIKDLVDLEGTDALDSKLLSLISATIIKMKIGGAEMPLSSSPYIHYYTIIMSYNVVIGLDLGLDVSEYSARYTEGIEELRMADYETY